jgi:hypothetical protein
VCAIVARNLACACAAALIYPIAYPPTAALAARTTGELTRDYIRTSQYLTALSNAVGDLILSFNNVCAAWLLLYAVVESMSSHSW